MPSLSDASLETKQIIKAVTIFIASILIIFFIIKFGLIIKDSYFQSAPEKAAEAFGKLPQQTFPPSITDKKFNYNLNTVTGNFPNFQKQIKVYRLQRNAADLLAVNKMDAKVKNIGFDQGYTSVTDRVFQWSYRPSSREVSKTLTANIFTGDFVINSGYLNDPQVLTANRLRSEQAAIDEAKNVLTAMQLPIKDLNMKDVKTNLYSIVNGQLTPASSFSQAQVVEAYFVQNDIDKIPVVYDKPDNSNISISVSGGVTLQIVSAKYIHHQIGDEYSTYNLKPVNQAFEELKKGNGYISSYTGNTDNIGITEVTLSYYMSNETQDFLMPVYVFKGNDDFIAYVPALMDESISK